MHRRAEAARALNARAFTLGRDVVFGERQYTPGATVGRWLLAHELAHVVQQDSGVSARSTHRMKAPAQRVGLPSGYVPTYQPMPIVRHDTSPVVRRDTTIPENTTRFQITKQPSNSLEIRNLLGRWRALPKTPGEIEFTASVDVNCGQTVFRPVALDREIPCRLSFQEAPKSSKAR